jgi:hypothetical protein
MPAPFEIIDEPMTWYELRKEYDRALGAALRLLGVDSDFDGDGMPSEYRGWLAYASEGAQQYLALPRSDRGDDRRRGIAQEITAGASAVAFSMRHGFATLPYTMAAALAGLRQYMPEVTQ